MLDQIKQEISNPFFLYLFQTVQAYKNLSLWIDYNQSVVRKDSEWYTMSYLLANGWV